jgi:hypothetical protein
MALKYCDENEICIIAECESCNKQLKIAKNKCSKVNNGYKVNDLIRCECKNYSGIISIKTRENKNTQIYRDKNTINIISSINRRKRANSIGGAIILIIFISLVILFITVASSGSSSSERYLNDTLQRAQKKSLTGDKMSPDEKSALDSYYQWEDKQYDQQQREKFYGK